MQDQKIKAILIQNVVSPYRIPLFELIGKSPEVDCMVLLTTSYCKHRPHWNWNLNELPFECRALPGMSWAKDHAKTFFFSPTLFTYLVRKRPDVVVSNGFSPATVMTVAYTTLYRKRNLIWSESTHVTEANIGCVKRLYRRWLASFVHGFIDAGQLSRDYLQSLISERDKRPFFRVYNCVETGRFSKPCKKGGIDLRLSKDRNKILFVGRLDENKNVRTLIAAYEQLLLKFPKIPPQLVLVGEGPLSEFVRSKQEALGSNNLVVVGQVSYDAIPAYYQCCDVFTLLSFSDCNPLVILEALSVGMPIICSSRAGNAVDFIRVGTNGFIVEPDGVKEISERLSTCLSWNDKQRSKAAVFAKEVISKTVYSSVADNFLAAIRAEKTC